MDMVIGHGTGATGDLGTGPQVSRNYYVWLVWGVSMVEPEENPHSTLENRMARDDGKRYSGWWWTSD